MRFSALPATGRIVIRPYISSLTPHVSPMPSSRSDILARIRRSLPHAYLPAAGGGTAEPPLAPPFQLPLSEVFADALVAVQGTVHRVRDEDSARAYLLAEFREMDVTQVLCWEPDSLPLTGLADALSRAGIQCVPSDLAGTERKVGLEQLAGIEVGLTGADAGLACTGSIVLLASEAQGRLASLMPPVHYAVLRAGQIYPDLAAWLASEGAPEAIVASSNTVIITGPSRTADIAQTLTLGAHGPRELHVILVEG